MSTTKRLLLIILCTSLFLFLITLFEILFFRGGNQHIEDNYMEKSRIVDVEDSLENINLTEKKVAEEILSSTIKKEQEKKKKVEDFLKTNHSQQNTVPLSQKKDLTYTFTYFPEEIHLQIQDQVDLFQYFLSLDFISTRLSFLQIDFFSKEVDVRGKMKDATIKLFGVLNLKTPELFSVFVHEFGHYIDIYSLKNDFVGGDISDNFYDLSWEGTKVVRSGQKQIDFVSGYAMTNKYEDFAESFVYYVLHNRDFQEKSKDSPVLQSKFNFLQKKVFAQKEFLDTDFSPGNKVQSYYRDITKIEVDTSIFLQYIKKFI